MIKLLNGDCLELMETILDKSVDSIITDPPYGTTACKWDSVIDFGLMWEQLERIIKPNGAIVLFGSEPFSSALRMSNIKNYKYDWIWQKHKASNFMLAKKQPMKVTENISVFYKKQSTYNLQLRELTEQGKKRNNRTQNGTFNKKETVFGDLTNLKVHSYKGKNKGYPLNVLKFNGVVNNQYSKKLHHPTQKPVELMEYLIKTYTNENETVLDFTMGSGSTGVACVNTNRKFIGIEQDEKYFEIATKRIEDSQRQTSLKL